MKIVILGGTGGQGLHSTKEIVRGGVFDEIVVASRNLENTKKILEELESEKLRAEQVDVMDREALMDLIKDADVVANCTGPYYLLGEKVVDAAIEAGVDYIDFCDDIVVHQKIFNEANQNRAKEKGVSVIIGLGQSPGIMPLEAVHGASLMDKVNDIDILMTIDSHDDADGPAVLLHVIENFVGEVEIIREGKKYYERPMDGAEYFDFGGPFGESLIATMGHPEVFSLPRVFPDAKNIEVKLGFWPSEYFEDIMMLSERGLALDNEISVNGQMVNRRNFLVGHIIDSLNNEEIKASMVKPYGLPVSAWVVIVRGLKDGKRIKYKKTTYSQMGPSTGFSLAVGAEMLAQGKIEKKGLMVPEECIEPEPFVEEVATRSRKAGHFYFSKEQITTEEVLFGKEEI